MIINDKIKVDDFQPDELYDADDFQATCNVQVNTAKCENKFR